MLSESFIDKIFNFLRSQIAKQMLAKHGATGKTVTVSATLGSGYSVEDEENRQREQIVAFARAQLGEPYVFGVEGPSDRDLDSWDCSELIEHSYANASMRIPDGTMNQRPFCQKVNEPKAADLAFLGPNANGIGHVFMYAGNGVCIEARGKPISLVRETARFEVESHVRFLGWYRHPDFARPKEDRV